MTASLRRMIFATLGAALLLSPLSAAAQGRPGPGCAPHDRHCAQPQHGRPHAPPPHAAPQAHRPPPPMAHAPQYKPKPPHALRPGHSAAKGRPFQRGKHSRFQPPPRGQEYRVVDNHLVLADSKTLKIIAVMGLMNELLR